MEVAMFWMLMIGCSSPGGGAGGPDDTGTDSGGQTGEEYPTGCEEVGRTAIAADDASELGFSLDDVLAFAGGPHVGQLDWWDEGSTPSTLDLEAEGTVDWVQRAEPESSGTMGLGAPAMMCGDLLEFPSNVSFRTDDGAFDESWAIAVQATVADSVDLWASEDADDLVGTYQIERLVAGSPNPSLSFSASLDPSGASGTIWEQPGEAAPPPPTGSGSGSTGAGGTGVAYPSFQVATWSTP